MELVYGRDIRSEVLYLGVICLEVVDEVIKIGKEYREKKFEDRNLIFIIGR